MLASAVYLLVARKALLALGAGPYLGALPVLQALLLVPHLVIMYALNVVMSVILLLAWAPVLFTGAYPIWAREMASGYLRWSVRVQAYFYGLTDAYPPFRVDN